MQTNTTKAKLAEGQTVYGAIISRFAPDLVEIFGAIGYDFVMIDCEHGPMDLEQVEHMVRAAEVFGITPIARIPNHSDSTILRFLDRGVQGIIVPHVNTKLEALAVCKAARYHPDGARGVGGGGLTTTASRPLERNQPVGLTHKSWSFPWLRTPRRYQTSMQS